MIRFHREATIDAAPEKIWAVLADFPNVYRWAPAVARSFPIDERRTSGVGAGRTCEVPGFGTLNEQVDHWDEGREVGYTWTASGPVKQGASRWTVSRADGRTHVRVEIQAEMRWGPLGKILGHTLLKSRMGRFMEEALAGLDHHVRTGEDVDGELAARIRAAAA